MYKTKFDKMVGNASAGTAQVWLTVEKLVEILSYDEVPVYHYIFFTYIKLDKEPILQALKEFYNDDALVHITWDHNSQCFLV